MSNSLKLHIAGKLRPYSLEAWFVLLITVYFNSSGSQSWSISSGRGCGDIASHHAMPPAYWWFMYWGVYMQVAYQPILVQSWSFQFWHPTGQLTTGDVTKQLTKIIKCHPSSIGTSNYSSLLLMTSLIGLFPDISSTIKFFLIILIRHDLSFLCVPIELCTL